MITRTPTQIKHREMGVYNISFHAYMAAHYWHLNWTDNRGSIFNTLDKGKNHMTEYLDGLNMDQFDHTP